jgi:hypothetical protein
VTNLGSDRYPTWRGQRGGNNITCILLSQNAATLGKRFHTAVSGVYGINLRTESDLAGSSR